MARGPRYKVPRRRRREGRTNYYRRYRMIKSGQKLRAVIRKTNTQIIVQIIEFAPNGDKTLIGVTSKKLRRFGWKGSLKSTPAAYLTGLIAGLKARKAGIEYVIPDIGLHPSVRGSRIYAAIKGLKDAGVEVPASEEVLPSEDRIQGKHIAEYARKLAEEKPEEFQKRFSQVLSRGLDPRELPDHFLKIRDIIIGYFQAGD